MTKSAKKEPGTQLTAPEADAAVMTGLTQEEAEFVHNVEVLGMPVVRAASLAGMPLNRQSSAHIAEARAIMRKQVRGDTRITKDDIIYGMMDAVGRAKLFAEPATEIIGLKEVARLMGFDQPQKIDVNIRTTIEVMRQQARGLSLEELLASVPGSGEVIDVEFYESKE